MFSSTSNFDSVLAVYFLQNLLFKFPDPQNIFVAYGSPNQKPIFSVPHGHNWFYLASPTSGVDILI